MYSIILRRFRVIIAFTIFLILLVGFIDIHELTGQWSTDILRTQFVPALLGGTIGSIIILISLLLLTFVFGRAYCSWLCPLGIYQDIIRRIANFFRSKKARRVDYHKPHHLIRYITLTLVVIALVLGSSSLLLWLDPYSNFGRMATNLFRPAFTASSNLLANIFPSIPIEGYRIFTLSAILAAAAIFLMVSTLSAFRGRLYCNTICPVGSFLGLISKYSLFQLHMNPEACNRCTLCSKQCKAECINVPAQQIDHSRCVQCYNCMTTCNRSAISYTFKYKKGKKSTGEPMVDAPNRRIFLGAIGTLAAAGVTRAFVPAMRKSSNNTKAIAPPGSRSIDHLKAHCTACHACVANCPSNVIRPAISEYGLDGLMLPVLDYNRSFCNYDCTACSHVCPTGAIEPLSKEEKALTQIGKARFYGKRCIVVRDETDCGACDEHCPANAITMIPFRDGLMIPKVDKSLCIGCGGCEYICPARPEKAIIVVANQVHQTAKLIKEEKAEEKKVDDFGF